MNKPWFFLLLLVAGLNTALAQVPDTRFSFQGKLELSGQFANGNYDFFVYVYDAETGGNLLGSQLIPGVNVEQGEFALVVDAGDVFNAGPVWLEIAAGPAGGALTTLSGRTQVQLAPQSQYAEMAFNIPDGVVTAAKVDNAQVQLRVNGSCAANTAMTAVNADGTVSCAAVHGPYTTTNVATVTVDGAPGQYTSLHNAVADMANWCTDSTKPCIIHMGAGNYTLPDVTLSIGGNSDVIIQGAGQGATRITAGTSSSPTSMTTVISSTVVLTLQDLRIDWYGPAGSNYLVDVDGLANLSRTRLDMYVSDPPTYAGVALLRAIPQTQQGGGMMYLEDSELNLYISGGTNPVEGYVLDVAVGYLRSRNMHYNGQINGANLGTSALVRIDGNGVSFESSHDNYNAPFVHAIYQPASSNAILLVLEHAFVYAGQAGVKLNRADVLIQYSNIMATTAAVQLANANDFPTFPSVISHSQLSSEDLAGTASILDLGSSTGTPQPLLLRHSSLVPSNGGSSASVIANSGGFNLTCVANTAAIQSAQGFFSNTCP